MVADDHALLREGVMRVIERSSGLRVVAEAADGHETLRVLGEIAVDVLLLDISMPGPGFLETLRRALARQPGLRVLVLSAHPEDEYAVRALRTGAAGYLCKTQIADELVTATRRVSSGGRYVSPALAEQLLRVLEGGATRAPHDELSAREYQVLCMLGSGMGVTEVAGLLNLSPKTVSTYRARMLKKLDLRNTSGLVRYAVEHGLPRTETGSGQAPPAASASEDTET